MRREPGFHILVLLPNYAWTFPATLARIETTLVKTFGEDTKVRLEASKDGRVSASDWRFPGSRQDTQAVEIAERILRDDDVPYPPEEI